MINYLSRDVMRLQPWEGYFSLRKKEFEILSHFFNIPKVSLALDIGCGCGLTSLILASFADRVIASDLFKPDLTTDTKGIKKAAQLINNLKIKNIHLVSSFANKLPFKSGKIDLIFSQYVLEHVPLHLRKEAVKEMKRVLSKDGVIITIVPNFLDRIYNYPYYYFDLFSRLLALLREKVKTRAGSKMPSLTAASDDNKIHESETINKKISRLLLPPLHGNYSSHLHEITKQFPFVWERLFKENSLNIIKTFTIKHTPLATKFSIRLYEKSTWITKILGDVAPFKYLGDCYCIIAKK